MKRTEQYLVWAIRIGLGALLLTPFVVSGSMYFPFITGKNFFFRVVVEIIFGAWVALATIAPQYRPRRSPMLLALIAFTGVITLATIFGVDPYHSFWSNLERMEGLLTHLHLLALFFVLGHVLRNKQEWMYALYGFVAVGIVVALHALLQFVGVLDIVGVYRPYAAFGNSIYLAGYLIFSIFFSVFLLLHVRAQALRWIYGSGVAMQIFAFFVAASRGAFIGFVVGAGVALFGLAFAYKNRAYRIAAGALLVFCALTAMLIVFFPLSYIVQRVELFSRLSSVSINSLSNDPRIIVWGMAIDGFKDRPLLGWGPENFIVPFGKFYDPALYGNEPWFDRTHNMFLEWLVAGGVVGFGAYVALLISACCMLRLLVVRKHLAYSEGVVFGGLFIAYAIQNAFVFDNIVSYIAIVFLYGFLHAGYLEKEGRAKVQMRQSYYPAIFLVISISTVALVYGVNVRPILAARGINTFMQTLVAHRPVDEVIATFDTVAAYDSFTTTELRERISESAIEIVTSATDRPSPQALALLQKAITELRLEEVSHSQNPRYPLFLGKALTFDAAWNAKSFAEAEMSYRRALELAPTYVQTHMGLAELNIFIGKPEEARKIALAIFEKAPHSAEMFYDTLTVMVASNDAKGALSVLKKYIDARIAHHMSSSFQSEKIARIVAQTVRITDLKSRAELLEELQKGTAPSVEIYLIAAQTYSELGMFDKSKEYAYKAVELRPELRAQVDAFFKNRSK